MEITTLDQTIKIELDPKLRTGVLVSGGMDSAILLFLILKEIADKNLNIDLTVYNVPNVADNAVEHSKDVVEFLEQYFNTSIKLVNIGLGTAAPLQLIRKPATELITNGLVDMLYSGQNQFAPEAKLWPEYIRAESGFVRRDPNSPDEPHARFPFIKLYKYHILELYRQFNLLELARITHSCTTQTAGKCAECLWCREREWAFTRLGLVD